MRKINKTKKLVQRTTNTADDSNSKLRKIQDENGKKCLL